MNDGFDGLIFQCFTRDNYGRDCVTMECGADELSVKADLLNRGLTAYKINYIDQAKCDYDIEYVGESEKQRAKRRKEYDRYNGGTMSKLKIAIIAVSALVLSLLLLFLY